MQHIDRWTIGYSPIAVKQFRDGKPVENKPNVQHCEVCEVEIESLAQMASALTTWQQGEFLLHGAPVYAHALPIAPQVRTRWATRTVLPRTKLPKPGKPNGFSAREHFMLVFDIDKLDGDELAVTLEERITYARSRLPDQFQKAECVGVLSASAGFKSGVRARLFFWNDRPTLTSDMQRYFRHAKHLIDTSIYQEHQMVFCAGPMILDATPDPFPQRVLHLAGEQLSFDASAPSPYSRKRTGPVEGTLDLDLLNLPDKRSGFDWNSPAPEGGRNNTIYIAARSCHSEGIPFEAGLTKVQAYNEEHCKPPLDDQEIERTVQSAYSSMLHPLDEGVLIKQVETVLKKHVVPTQFAQTFEKALPLLTSSFQHGLTVDLAQDVLGRWLEKHSKDVGHVDALGQRPLLEAAAAIPPPPMEPWRQLLEFNDEGTGPKQSLTNVMTLMREHPDLRVVVDTNTQRLFWVTCPFDESQAGQEVRKNEHDVPTRVWVSKRLGDGPAADKYSWETLQTEARRGPNRINYLGAVMRSLRWDGVVRLPRIAEWAFGCETELENRALHLWFAHAARRALYPGSPSDVTIVLKGDEGIGKSHFIDRLGLGNPGLISRLPRDFQAKDTIMALRGRLVCAADELEGLRGREAEEAKEFLTRYRDEVRLPYQHDEVSLPRTYSFIASTNEGDFLSSSNGNRRFVVLECRRELPHGQFEPAQAALLWAEAVATFPHVPELSREEKLKRAETIGQYVQDVNSEMAEKVARSLQGAEWIAAAPAEWKDQTNGLHTLSGAFVLECLNLRLDSANLRRVSKVMRSLGWEYVKSNRTRLWRRK